MLFYVVMEVYSNDSLAEAAISSQRSSIADFFRPLFEAIEGDSHRFKSALPIDFKLTDNSFSIIANCSLNLGQDEIIDSISVKGVRQRLREDRNKTGIIKKS